MSTGDEALLPPVATPPRRVWVGAAHGDFSRAWAPLTLRVPGSKYYTLRYLLVALLADGESLVRGPALSDDTAVLVRALGALGAEASWERDGAGWALRVRGMGGQLRVPPGGTVEVGNAGAVLRLLLGLGTLLSEVRFTTDHPESLGRRPNRDLLEALEALGIETEAEGAEGRLPIALRGGPPTGGEVTISGARSSQYLSALLYLGPLLARGLEISVVDDLRSAPLLRATLATLALAGIRVEAAADLRHFRVPGGQIYRAGVYDVPGDAPSAAALLAAAATLQRPLRLMGLDPAQEDVAAVVGALRALGAPLGWETGDAGHNEGLQHGGHEETTANTETAEGTEGRRESKQKTVSESSAQLCVSSPRYVLALAKDTALRGTTLDGDAIIDSVPVLAAAACFAHGETRFERVATLRLKESDRIGDLCAELGRAGADLSPEPDAIVVHGRAEGIAGGVEMAGHDDHRLVQALAIAALGSRDGLTITGAEAVAKSYPDFFEELARMGARVE